MKYKLICISTDAKFTTKEYDAPSVPLEDLRECVGGYIEIVRPAFLEPVEPFLLMVLDEDGKLKEKPINDLASLLYCNPFDCIVGNVVIGTRFNEDPTAEPDIYAMPDWMSDKVERYLKKIVGDLG